MNSFRLRCFLLMVSWIGISAFAAAEVVSKPWRAGNVQAVEAWTRAAQQPAGNTNVWIARGLVAHRDARTVAIVVEATGLNAGAIVEFLAVGETSEKEYEALTVSFAAAGDICRALEFLGLPRGRPIDPASCRFWPRGEYVKATIRPLGRDAKTGWPLSDCLQDKRPHATPAENFVYVGSCWSGAVCQADLAAPGALISTYNEPSVVLDVPRRAPQAEVYGNLVVSAEGAFAGGTLLVIELTPELLPGGVPRALELVLDACRAPQAVGDGLATVACLTYPAGDRAGAGGATNDIKGALEWLATAAKSGRDPFVDVVLDDGLAVRAVHDLTRVLAMVEGQNGLRIEAPSAGQLYYKAFLPDERWRPRQDRPSQPWELRIARNKAGDWTSTLVQILEDWSKEGQLAPDLTATEFALAHPEDLPGKIRELIDAQIVDVKRKLAQSGKPVTPDMVDQLATLKRINTIFVFAPPEAPLGTFMPAVRRVHDTLPQVHVFVDAESAVDRR